MLIEKKKYMYKLAEELFPINRSITGNGLRESLKIINALLKKYLLLKLSKKDTRNIEVFPVKNMRIYY